MKLFKIKHFFSTIEKNKPSYIKLIKNYLKINIKYYNLLQLIKAEKIVVKKS